MQDSVCRGEFANSDKDGWFPPSDVQTGPRGDFYLPDQRPGRSWSFGIGPGAGMLSL